MNKPRSQILQLLRGVERPGRYLGDEYGVPAPLASDVRLRLVLGFPDAYEVGMSHLGFRQLHASLLARDDLVVERVFLPWIDVQQRLQQRHVSLFALESQRPLTDFDLVGLSVQYELAYPAVVKMLDLAQMPRLTEQRLASSRRYPLILVGGAAALNPEPLADFVDAFFLGEADHEIHRFVDTLADLAHLPRRQQLEHLCRLPGIYVPALSEAVHLPNKVASSVRARPPAVLPVERQWVEDLDALEVPTVQLVPNLQLIHNRVTVEIQRGCCQGCRFCQAGFVTRPTRQRRSETVTAIARRLLDQSGHRALALLSLSAGDHLCLQPMLASLIQEHGPSGVAVSLPSLRTESLHPTVAKQISRNRRTTFTLAPEAATDRLRRVINKQNTDEDLLQAVDAVLAAGFSRIKLYFMIGLPTETEEDVRAITTLSRAVAKRAKKTRKNAGITVAVSTFVPKPHTPFQWEAAPDYEQVRTKLRLLQATVPRPLRLRWHDAGQSVMEAVMARGDRRMGRVLERLMGEDHYGLDSWTEHFDLERWQGALDAAHDAGEIPDPALYLAARDPADPLPWDHLDVGLDRDYLVQQRGDALAGITRPDCTDGTCDQCGVCPAEPLHRVVEPEPRVSDPKPKTERSESPEAAAVAEQPEPTRVRLWFSKRHKASLVSHLELIGVFERATRRAKLNVAFSKGFHPKPKIRFSPALPLGAESLCELAEITLHGSPTPRWVAELLAPQLPPGLEIQRAEPGDDPVLQRISGIHWILRPDPPLSRDIVQGALDRLAAEPVEVQRPGRKAKVLNEFLHCLAVNDDGALAVHTRFDTRGTVRPEDLLRSLFGFDDEKVLTTQMIRAGWDIEKDR